MLFQKSQSPTLITTLFDYLKIIIIGASSAIPAFGLAGICQYIVLKGFPQHGISGWGAIIALLSLLCLSVVIPVWFIKALNYNNVIKKVTFFTGWLLIIGMLSSFVKS